MDRGLVKFFVRGYADKKMVTFDGAIFRIKANPMREPEVSSVRPRKATAKDAQKTYLKLKEAYCA